MPRLGLRLTPHGRLSAEEQDDGPEIDGAASIRLIDAFARGTGYGLVWLGAAEVGQALPPLFVWWRDFAALYVGSLCLHASGLAMMLIDRAVVAYQNFIRVTGWTGNTALMVEAEFFGRDRPRAGLRDRHGEIRGLTVEEYINRLGQDLIPLAERCGRVMREALAALETVRAVPSSAVERSKPISLSV